MSAETDNERKRQTQDTFPKDTFIVHSNNYCVDPETGQLEKTAPDELVKGTNRTLIGYGLGCSLGGIISPFYALEVGSTFGSIVLTIVGLIFIIGGVALVIIGKQAGNEMAELYYNGIPLLGKITSIRTRDVDPIPPDKDFDLGRDSYYPTRYYFLDYDFTTPNGIDVTGEEIISSINIAGPQVPSIGKNVIVLYLKEGKFKIA